MQNCPYCNTKTFMRVNRFIVSKHKAHPLFKHYLKKPVAPFVPISANEYKLCAFVIALFFNIIMVPFAIMAMYIIYKSSIKQRNDHEQNLNKYKTSFACTQCGKVGGSVKGKVYKYTSKEE